MNALLSQPLAAFPDGMIPKHEAFVFIAAGNTTGAGADMKFVGRNQLDGATLDRFVFVFWEIDEDRPTLRRRGTVVQPSLCDVTTTRPSGWRCRRPSDGTFARMGVRPGDMPFAFHRNGSAAMYHALMRGERGQIAEFDIVNAADWSAGRDKSAFRTIPRPSRMAECADE